MNTFLTVTIPALTIMLIIGLCVGGRGGAR